MTFPCFLCMIHTPTSQDSLLRVQTNPEFIHECWAIYIERIDYLTNMVMWWISHTAILPPHHPSFCTWISAFCWLNLEARAALVCTYYSNCFWIISFVRVNCKRFRLDPGLRDASKHGHPAWSWLCSWHGCLLSCRPVGVSVVSYRLSSPLSLHPPGCLTCRLAVDLCHPSCYTSFSRIKGTILVSMHPNCDVSLHAPLWV